MSAALKEDSDSKGCARSDLRGKRPLASSKDGRTPFPGSPRRQTPRFATSQTWNVVFGNVPFDPDETATASKITELKSSAWAPGRLWRSSGAAPRRRTSPGVAPTPAPEMVFSSSFPPHRRSRTAARAQEAPKIAVEIARRRTIFMPRCSNWPDGTSAAGSIVSTPAGRGSGLVGTGRRHTRFLVGPATVSPTRQTSAPIHKVDGLGLSAAGADAQG